MKIITGIFILALLMFNLSACTFIDKPLQEVPNVKSSFSPVFTPKLSVNSPVPSNFSGSQIIIDDTDTAKLNKFLSDFLRLNFISYNETTSTDSIITLAINYICSFDKNSLQTVENFGEACYIIKEDDVKKVIKKFFDTEVTMKGVKKITYMDNAFYVPVTETVLGNTIAQALHNTINPDSSMDVIFAEYLFEPGIEFSDKMYTPKRTWSSEYINNTAIKGNYIAKVRVLKNTEKTDYILVSLKKL